MFPLKITIDTKEDSHEDIKKIVALLSQMIGKDSVTNSPQNLFENSSSSELPNLMAMFDSSNQNTTSAAPEQKIKRVPNVELY